MSEGLGNLVEAAMACHLENTHTAIPGVVTAVSGSRVSVKPALNRKLRDGRIEALPVIPNIPIWFPEGGGASITWPVKAGDGCLLVFSERSLDEWKGSGGDVTPGDPRKHALSDAVALVGLSPNTEATDGIVLKMGSVSLTINETGVTVSGGSFTVENTSGGGVNFTGGTVRHNGKDIGDTHRHPILGGSSAPGPTGEPM